MEGKRDEAFDVPLRVMDAVKKHAPLAIRLSDDMAANPERSGSEFEASKKMVQLLSGGGYKVEYPFCGYDTAFNAVLSNGDGASVAILAEYDALPEIGHACGHNVHGSMAILAGLALAEMKDEFKGILRIIGTPAEEENGAKVGMAERGVFDGLDLAMMIHSLDGGSNIPDMALMALKSYEFTFSGETAHGAVNPWAGRNAVSAARKFLDLIDARRQMFMPGDRVNGIITDGGRLTNIIPDKAVVQVEMRADKMSRVQTNLFPGVLNCAKGAALALDCEVVWTKVTEDFADMVQNKPAQEAIAKIMHGLGLKTSPVLAPAGSSDMGNVSYRCPSIQPLLAITEESLGLHTRAMALATTKQEAHDAIVTGAAVMVLMALNVFNNRELRLEIIDSFKKASQQANASA